MQILLLVGDEVGMGVSLGLDGGVLLYFDVTYRVYFALLLQLGLEHLLRPDWAVTAWWAKVVNRGLLNLLERCERCSVYRLIVIELSKLLVSAWPYWNSGAADVFVVSM